MFHTTSPFRPHRASTPEFALEKPAPTPALKPGAGMGLADDTPIPTPDGWTTVGEIGVGQQAFDERGEPCTVVGVHPQGNQPVCRVIFDDSSVLVAGTRHEWLTITDLQRSKIHEGTSSLALWPTLRFFGITTEEVRLSLTHNAGGCIKTNHSIPLAKTLQASGAGPVNRPLFAGTVAGRRIIVPASDLLRPKGRTVLPSTGAGRRRKLAYHESEGKCAYLRSIRGA